MAARAQRKAPTYFTLKSCKRSSSTLSIGPVALAEPPGAEPLLTRICRPPSRSTAWATARSTCSRLVTSATSGMTLRPVWPSSSRAAASRRSFVRATIATSTPSRASSSAIALPMPRLPPVTSARLPFSPRSMSPPFSARLGRRGPRPATACSTHGLSLSAFECEEIDDRAHPRDLVQTPERLERAGRPRATQDVLGEIAELSLEVGVRHGVLRVALRVLGPLGVAPARAGRHLDLRGQLAGE